MLASIRMGRADALRLRWRVATAALLAGFVSFASLVVLESPAAAAPVAPGTVANPTLPAQCGLKVMLVVDSSGSIGGAATQVTGAVSAFLDQLTDTGSEVGVVDFDTQVNDVVPYTPVTPANVAGVFQDYLDGYSVGGGTNWAAALNKARTVPTGGDLPDLVLFLTDGRPTYRGGYVGPAGPIALTDDGDGSQTSGPERVEAANRADEIKTQGTHMFLVGVGNALGNPSAGDLQSIQAVTGNQQYPTSTTNIGAADYSLIANFGALAEAFRQLVYAICDTSVTVTKLVDANNDGVGEPANGYSITGTVQTVNGGANAFTWSQPLPATPAIAPNRAHTRHSRERHGDVPMDAGRSGESATIPEHLRDHGTTPSGHRVRIRDVHDQVSGCPRLDDSVRARAIDQRAARRDGVVQHPQPTNRHDHLAQGLGTIDRR